jgi:hypothetical protein
VSRSDAGSLDRWENYWMKKTLLSFIVAMALSGCATIGVGNPARSETGTARNPPGELFRTETLTPGIGSALFPNPNWK